MPPLLRTPATCYYTEDIDRHSPSAEGPIPPVMCGPLPPAEKPPQPINHFNNSALPPILATAVH